MNRVIAVICLVLSATSARADATADFNALLDEVWEARLEAFPVFASTLGDHRYNDRWPDQSLDAIEARRAQRREYLRRLYAIDRSALSEVDQTNYELFRRELQNQVDREQFNGHLMPFSQRGGVQALHTLTAFLPLATVKDYENWLARMARIDTVVEQIITLAERGRREGYVSPSVLMQRIPAQIDKQLVEVGSESPFYAKFESIPDTIGEADQARLQASAIETIEGVVVPAYRGLARYFEKTYLPAARDSVGLSSLPNGSAWYEFLARHFTTTRMSPDEIHRLGLSEVKRIRDEMQTIIDELEFGGDFQAFLEFLRTDPQFYYDDPDELYEAYLATSKRIDPELVKLFGKLPRAPYGVKPIPDETAPDTTTAYYSPPAADGSRAGIYLGQSIHAGGAAEI